MDQIKIGKFIAENRKLKNMTQSELAERLGVSDRTISKWETGRGIPELSLLEPLSEILDITVSELLKGEKVEDKLKVADSNIVDILKEKKSEINKKKLIAIISLIIILCLSLFSLYEYRKNKELEDNELHITYNKDGYFINYVDTKISIEESKILYFEGKNENEIRNISNEEKDLIISSYYSEIENYYLYGFLGQYVGNGKDNDIKLLKLLNKRYTPFILTDGENVFEQYCYLGNSKYGTFLLGKYENNECIVNDKVCVLLKDNNSEVFINANDYCK